MNFPLKSWREIQKMKNNPCIGTACAKALNRVGNERRPTGAQIWKTGTCSPEQAAFIVGKFETLLVC